MTHSSIQNTWNKRKMDGEAPHMDIYDICTDYDSE